MGAPSLARLCFLRQGWETRNAHIKLGAPGLDFQTWDLPPTSTSHEISRSLNGPTQEYTMNLANIWNHPRTTAAGLLIGVASIGSVLAQQGITLGKAGTGSV